MDEIQKRLLKEVADLDALPVGAYNIRADGQAAGRRSTANIEIVPQKERQGIEIHVKDGTVNESMHIPVIMQQSGLKDLVYNDFYIGENCDITIVAGCGIHNCGVLAHVRNGRVVKLEGNPEYPMSKGALCAKALSGVSALYHPNRNKYPLLRVGKRGENKWRRISWNEAIDIIAKKMETVRHEYGVEAVLVTTGGGGNPASFEQQVEDAFFSVYSKEVGMTTNDPEAKALAETSFDCIKPADGNFYLNMEDENHNVLTNKWSKVDKAQGIICLLYTSPSPRDCS